MLFFFKQKKADEISACVVGSKICVREKEHTHTHTHTYTHIYTHTHTHTYRHTHTHTRTITSVLYTYQTLPANREV